MEYGLLIDFEVVEFMASMKRPEKEALRRRFLEIRDWPQKHADYQDRDAQGRPVSVNLCGKYAIIYWDDFADRHVKILDIRPADASAL